MKAVTLSVPEFTLNETNLRVFECPSCAARRAHVDPLPGALAVDPERLPQLSQERILLLVRDWVSRTGLTSCEPKVEGLQGTRGREPQDHFVLFSASQLRLINTAVAASMPAIFPRTLIEICDALPRHGGGYHPKTSYYLTGLLCSLPEIEAAPRWCRDCLVQLASGEGAVDPDVIQHQGHLALVPLDADGAPDRDHLGTWIRRDVTDRFFNHHLVTNDDSVRLSVRKGAGNLAYICGRPDATAVISSPDHPDEQLDLMVGLGWLLYHPIPDRDGDVD